MIVWYRTGRGRQIIGTRIGPHRVPRNKFPLPCSSCEGVEAGSKHSAYLYPSRDVMSHVLCRLIAVEPVQPPCQEQYYIVGFAREVALVLAVIYVDNVSLYMVSVYHKYRMQNIFLQDNGRLMLEFVFRQSIFVKAGCASCHRCGRAVLSSHS